MGRMITAPMGKTAMLDEGKRSAENRARESLRCVVKELRMTLLQTTT